jgi:hypothetical protein
MTREQTEDKYLPTVFNLFDSVSTLVNENLGLPLHIRYVIVVKSTKELSIRIDQKEITDCDDSIWLRFEWPVRNNHTYSFTVGKAIGMIINSHPIRGMIRSCVISNGNHYLKGPYEKIFNEVIVYHQRKIEFGQRSSFGHHVSIRLRLIDKMTVRIPAIREMKPSGLYRRSTKLIGSNDTIVDNDSFNFDATSSESDDSDRDLDENFENPNHHE